MNLKAISEHRFFKWFLAAVIFAVTFYSRALFVDTYYQYSFEADSEACVSVSKSFYNFFKNPSKETIPLRLSDYPPYQDGDFIFAGITGNVVRHLAKAGIITADIGDGDNSIVIYAMRWNSVIFQAIIAVLVFLIVCLISGSNLFSFFLLLLYYILSPQILDFALARIDHYYFFAAALVIYASIRLFQNPEKTGGYIFLGVSVAMVMATKLNFPFYLVLVLFTLIHFIASKKISLKNFLLAFCAFLLMWCFLFQRWLFYPEEVVSTVKGIWQTGDDWVNFWGIKPYLYYHYHQFFSEGFSWGVILLLIGWLGTFILTVWQAMKQKDAMAKVLVLTFVAQSLMLMIVPKVGRYGTVIPIWICIFFAYSAHYLCRRYKLSYAYLLLLLVLPNAVYAFRHYQHHPKQWAKVKPSIEATRLPAYEWIKGNVPDGSVVAVYHPRISNPPIMELPISTPEKYLYYPFLYGDKAANFQPLSLSQLENKVNYVVLNNQYYNYHFWLLDNLIESGLGNAEETKKQWQGFYDSLAVKYTCETFEATSKNYGINWYKIYTIDSVPKNKPVQFNFYNITLVNSDSIRFDISSTAVLKSGEFELQISTDPTFRWVDFASIDGFPSKYREGMIGKVNFIPAKVDSLIGEGLLDSVSTTRKIYRADINTVFRGVIEAFAAGAATLDDCLGAIMTDEYKPQFYQLLGSIYGLGEESKTFTQEEFMKALDYDEGIENKLNTHSITIPKKLVNTSVQNYFRLRLKSNHEVHSGWLIGEVNY